MAVSFSAAAGGKRALDAELNLVPFIDLLVCCICFLLLTTVWAQLASMPARTGRSAAPESSSRPPPSLTVLVGSEGYTLSLDSERLVLPKQGAFHNSQALARELRRVRTALSEPPPLVIAGEDGVPMGDLIRAMDVARAASFLELTISDGRQLL